MVVLPEAVTLREATDTLRLLTQACGRDDAATLTVDASALKRFDSSALAVLLACRRAAQADAKGFELRGAPAPLLALAALYGVAELLKFAPPQEAAAHRQGQLPAAAA
jgi:phospholipid transport system transporter-binding protein